MFANGTAAEDDDNEGRVEWAAIRGDDDDDDGAPFPKTGASVPSALRGRLNEGDVDAGAWVEREDGVGVSNMWGRLGRRWSVGIKGTEVDAEVDAQPAGFVVGATVAHPNV